MKSLPILFSNFLFYNFLIKFKIIFLVLFHEKLTHAAELDVMSGAT